MCGIAGIFANPGRVVGEALLRTMGYQLIHRGPDNEGIWLDPKCGVGLVHRRLSIIDLSAYGNQPMISHDGRFVLVYNGEVYNYQALRADLEREKGIEWCGHSDTEVLLAAIEHWGLKSALKRANGMFSFALWDRREQTLTLARDRLGEKPLYVAWIPGAIVFASELKALRTLSGWCNDIDHQALGYFLRFGYVPAPLSIHRGVYKLPPANFIILDAGLLDRFPNLEEFCQRCQCYWSLSAIADEGIGDPIDMDESTVLYRLEELLADSVGMRMEADVPVGAMLSGGIDSSLIVAVMQRLSSRPVRTFTVGFREELFDEAAFARSVAKHIGSEHTEIRLLGKDALDVIPSLPEIYDEPFADPSQIPTVLVSALARQQVIVALSGDGGDELFGGYGRYHAASRTWPILRWCPPMLRKGGGAVASALEFLSRWSLGNGGQSRLSYRAQRFGRRISADSFESYYSNLLSLSLDQTASTVWPSGLPLIPLGIQMPKIRDIEQRMMFIDQMSYLPDDILAKTDRASMAASLELRIPFLDYRIVEFTWRLPARLRRRGRDGKLLLRHILHRYVPKKLVERPKKGFDIPLDAWLRGPLRIWMLDLLNPDAMRKAGYLDPTVVTRLVNDHLACRGDHGYALWPLLMFESWLRCIG
jgi:asparagine synthase (glutamine-hydrolysing)